MVLGGCLAVMEDYAREGAGPIAIFIVSPPDMAYRQKACQDRGSVQWAQSSQAACSFYMHCNENGPARLLRSPFRIFCYSLKVRECLGNGTVSLLQKSKKNVRLLGGVGVEEGENITLTANKNPLNHRPSQNL